MVKVAPVAVAAPAHAKLTKAERRLQRQQALAKPAAAAAPAAAAVAVAATAAAVAPAQATRPLSAFELIQSERADTSKASDDSDANAAANAALVGVGGLTADRVQTLRESMASMAREEDDHGSFYANFASKAEELLGSKWRIVLGTLAVLVLVVMCAALWKLHKNSASNNPVKAAERADVSRTPEGSPSGMTAMAATPPAAAQPAPDKQTKTKEQAAKDEKDKAKQAATPAPTDTTPAAPTTQASLLDNGGLRTPTAMPKNVVKKEEASAELAPGILPYGGGSNAAITNVVSGMPIAQPKIAPQKVRVSSGVAQGMLVHRVTPQYPTQARIQGIQGTVVLQAVIGKDGGVKSLKAVSGNSMLRQAAMDAVKQWKYKPYSVDGEAVEADTEINVKFSPGNE